MTPEEAGDFYEDDEPLEDVLRAFGDGPHGLTARPVRTFTFACRHASVTGPLASAPECSGCGPMLEALHVPPGSEAISGWYHSGPCQPGCTCGVAGAGR